ncbi:MAG TPA: serine/threonine protein kinase [Leptolyngbyaceae cyanobacterium M33_DOE_097]|uniref:Protein kinase domain-containing protein n=1 Tax=Oscillatoriales cyanobacterium SpSt-418 TaxID=2282169 RepID=A0A7C3KHE1_9CYAN|nr:serine/threonine protein kinase [Leptolyngbyaceae cyanobacterium M33_DOE_097]
MFVQPRLDTASKEIDVDMIGQLLAARYLILERLGAGGFSETYLARDKFLPDYPLCVVKCLKLHDNNPIPLETAQSLFEMEAYLLERLGRQYTQIPTLLAYCHEPDLVYLVQEYIDGENLSARLARRQRLSVEEAIALLLELLSMLDLIHAHGVIHRDLTPSNVICRYQDGKAVLIDFGAACILQETDSVHSSEADHLGLAIGTPGYMPEEQHANTPRLNSDIYALGILIIHLLTGVDPKQYQRDPISGELDWQRYLSDTRLNSGLVEVLNRMVRGDFRDRYQQATDVLADMQTLGLVKRFHQQAQRSLWQKKAAQVALLTLVASLIGWLGKPYFLAFAMRVEQTAFHLRQQVQGSSVNLTLLKEVPRQSQVQRMLIAPNGQLLVTAEANHALYLWSLPDGKLLHSLMGHTTEITTLVISADNQLLISGSEDGSIHLWNIKTGKLMRKLKGHQQAVAAIAISPDARTFISGSQNGELFQWNIYHDRPVKKLSLPNTEVIAVTYGDLSYHLVSASSDRQLHVWDLRTGEQEQTFTGHTDEIIGLQMVKDQRLLSFGKDHNFAWDLKQKKLIHVFPKGAANPVTASACGQHIITVHDDGSLRVWSYKSQKLVMRESKQLGKNLNVALSPDHRYLASWGDDQRLRVWQLNMAGF